MKHTSGSPSAWKLRRVEYQKRSGPVSNPGQPSPVNRATRRVQARHDKAIFNAFVAAGAKVIDLTN